MLLFHMVNIPNFDFLLLTPLFNGLCDFFSFNVFNWDFLSNTAFIDDFFMHIFGEHVIKTLKRVFRNKRQRQKLTITDEGMLR